MSSPADIAIIGGSVYGGKTFSLVIEPLRHVAVPGFNFVIFRRTTPEIRNPGGLWDESLKWYPLAGADGLSGVLDWRFPSGARGKLSGLQHEANVTDWKGAQICLVMFDQLEEFTERQFFYLLSRNRSSCGVRPYARASCNPDADSWLASFVQWWWDEDTGYAWPGRSGVVRWFLRVDDTVTWADTTWQPSGDVPFSDADSAARAEMVDRFGIEAAGKAGRFVKSFTFVLARLQDNKIGVALDPGYEGNVRAMGAVERERLLGGDRGGNWKVRPAAGLVFQRGWFEVVDAAPSAVDARVRAWDYAATDGSGNWTVGVRMSRVGKVLYVEHVVRGQWAPGKRDSMVRDTAANDGASVPIRIPKDPAAAGVSQAVYTITDLAGYSVVALPVTGSKLLRAGPLASQASVENVKLVKGEWNEAFLRELHAFPTEGVPDDQVDAASDAASTLLGRSHTQPATPSRSMRTIR